MTPYDQGCMAVSAVGPKPDIPIDPI